MTSTPQKTAIASAISLAVGTMAGAPALADEISQIQITDVGSTLNGVGGGGSGTYSSAVDGNSGGFRFGNINPTTYNNTQGWTGDVGPMLAQQNANPTGSFSTGFIFSSTPFVPFTFGNGLAGNITVDKDGNPTLEFTDLNFGGNFQSGGAGTDFLLPPDAGTLNVNWVTDGANNDEKRVSFQWSHLITTAEDTTGDFTGFNARWIIEGIAKVSDAAPAIFIKDASGTVSDVSEDISQDIFVGSTYIDQGAVCQDVVDGDISANVTTTPADLSNVDTSTAGSFTVDYDCQDSATNAAPTVTRTVTINPGVDPIPPEITLLSPADPEAGRNDPDPTTVNILQGKTYVDAGASCMDNADGDISGAIMTTGLPVDTTAPGSNTLRFDCRDAAGNDATQQTRTVNVLADNEPPVITGVTPVLTVSVGGDADLSKDVTCTDTNPVDSEVFDITTSKLDINPPAIDTGTTGSFTVTYNCADDAGNLAQQQTRAVEVVAGQNFHILSMTISDVDGDGLAGCFKFNFLNLDTCAGANRFSSDGSGDIGTEASPKIPGEGKDKDPDTGEPIGVKFGEFQPITGKIPRPPELTQVTGVFDEMPEGLITPGFIFNSLPFVPMTFNPSETQGSLNRNVESPPEGFVTVIDDNTALMNVQSLPFGGIWQTSVDNLFFLGPDTVPEIIEIVDNKDDNGTTRTFNYKMGWSHFIRADEDPTGRFIELTTFWRLEGVITADSVPFVINNPPIVNAVSASQDGRDPTAIIVSDGGPVTVTVSAQDPDGNGLVFDWSNNPVTALGATNQASFTFDPASLSPGALGLLVTVTDDNSDDPLSAPGEIVLRLAETAPVLSDTQDTNGNGVPDATDGFGDDDADGIANYQDAVDGSVNPSSNLVDFRNPAAGTMVADAGRLVLGNTAGATGSGSFIVTEGDIAEYGGPGVTPTKNFRDVLSGAPGIGPVPNGIRDFNIQGLTPGAPVQIVIPQEGPLPPQPEYRKYIPAVGWGPFSRLNGNSWASAPKANGVCPGPNDSAYDSPEDSVGTILVEGDECVRLTIVDGGANDADRSRNGIVVDPGTVSGNGTASSASSGSGCSMAGSSTRSFRGDWLLVLMGLLGLFGYKRSQCANEYTKHKQ